MPTKDAAQMMSIASSLQAYHYHVLDRYGFIFCTIPKNAHRTVKRFLLDAASIHHLDTPDVDLHKLCEREIGLVRYPVEMRAELLASLPVFTVLRDPFERIASAFADRVVRPERREPNLPMYEWVHGPGCGYDLGISFREFIGYINVHADDVLDHHWRPQAAFLRGVDVEVLGDISYLHSALSIMARRFDIETPVPEDRPRAAAQAWVGEALTDIPSGELRKRGILPPADALYTPELRRAVSGRYASDLRLTRPLPVPSA